MSTHDEAASPAPTDHAPNFVRELVQADLAAGKQQGRVHTRFPPEPNGYLHVGHAKSICLNFGLAHEFGGKCNLRFDDTNPETEEVEYVESIKSDVRWLGFDWEGREYYASDYFDALYNFAVELIRAGKAYVDSRSSEEIRDTRGDFHTAGTNSPYRARSVEENLDLFTRMRAGEFADGAHVLRAKGDMASSDVKMRDPLMYRIRHAKHHRTGDKWCIYPMYDWAHGQSDYLEKITHSVCTLEFSNHRPLYHWFLDQIGADAEARPHQTEFARLNLTYTVLSKRRLQELVQGKHVSGWDDPRMPTLSGMRRRGYTARALRNFCDRIGVSTRDSMVDVQLLEHALREDLGATVPRAMGVLRPLKVVITNLAEGEVVELSAPIRPDLEQSEQRALALTREVYIEQDDFMEVPAKKYFRLSPGQEVRLRYACIVKCTDIVKDTDGTVVEVHVTWDPSSKGGMPSDGRKVKGTIHWVSAAHAVNAEVRLYDRLFAAENPMADKDNWLGTLNPHSVEELHHAKLEPWVASAAPGTTFQLERLGYFCVDKDSTAQKPLLNRTISLKDSFTPGA